MTKRDLYFAVEGGTTLELARAHVAECKRVGDINRALAKELGAEKYVVHYATGVISGVVFSGKSHTGFTRPRRNGVSFPKKGSEWERRFASVDGYDVRGYRLADALGIPTDISYTFDGGSGGGCVSSGFTSGVGFLWLSDDGPFALYIPDIAAVVAYYETQGYAVDDTCKNFVPAFDGARPILKEEWELVVAQHKADRAKAAVEVAA